jgi:hypothetical protein
MAKIKGVSLKNFKTIPGGEDGTIFGAQICINGKVVGSVTNDGWGGPNMYSWTQPNAEETVKRAASDYRKDPKNRQYDYMKLYEMDIKEFKEREANGTLPLMKTKDMLEDLDTFVHDLIALNEDEKDYKRALKKGFKGTYTLRTLDIRAPKPVRSPSWYCNHPLLDKLSEQRAEYPSTYGIWHGDPKDFDIQ